MLLLKGKWKGISVQKRRGKHGYPMRHVSWRIGGRRYRGHGEQAQGIFIRRGAIFSARYRRTGKKGASGRDEHRGFYGIKKGQEGVGLPWAVVQLSTGETGSPNQGGLGSRLGG